MRTQSVKGMTEAEPLHLQDVQQTGGTWSVDVEAQHRLLLLPHSSLGVWLRKVVKKKAKKQSLSLITPQVNEKNSNVLYFGCHGSKSKSTKTGKCL